MVGIRRIELVEPDNQPLLPHHVNRALAYMRANMSKRITLTGLASACGVPQRTLLRQFQRFVGLAPLAYLRRLRLNAAKSELANFRNNDAISDIAMRCGFSHLGRFATEYRQLFGETPTTTRQRVRTRAAEAKNGASRLSEGYPVPAVEREKPSLLILPLRTETLQERLEARDLTERLAATLSRIRVAAVALAHPLLAVSVSAPQPRNAGTRYCLLGRLTRRDERTRIVVGLVDVAADRHLWGDSFDGSVNDPFELQDRVVDRVLCGVVSRITDAEIERASNKDPRDRAARDLALRALPLVLGTSVRSAERAIAMLSSAIAMDPADAVATALLSYCHAQLASYHGAQSVADGWTSARHLSQRAGLLDSGDPLVTIARGTVAAFLKQPEEQEALVARALAMDPTSAWAWERRGYIRQGQAFQHHSVDEADAAIVDFHQSMRFRGPSLPQANCMHGIASAHYAAGRFDQAMTWARKALAENPEADWMHKLLSCSANKLGDKATVARSVDCMRRARPHLTVSEIVEIWPWADTGWLEAITRAGMPLGSAESRRKERDEAEHAVEIRVKG
ncbi:MAG TPA: helix-turn-helix domain-containing protein [Acetobacteraceae bacterium]|nr:helix-turn-helix domain-containing protein [Acetobacteraceae bacterium]